MKTKKNSSIEWKNLRIGITGASGKLGKSLIGSLRKKGVFVIGLTSKDLGKEEKSLNSPNQWIIWKCGKEDLLDKTLSGLDILILNHGVNYQGSQDNIDINNSLEINSLSTWRLIERFEYVASKNSNNCKSREIWVNTSEAEVLPALSPTYEISKRLIGNLVSIKMKGLFKNSDDLLNIRKIVLGPFQSSLNPIGIMDSNTVANQIIRLAELNFNLIIVSPNPITYLLVPITEFSRFIYFFLTYKFNKIK